MHNTMMLYHESPPSVEKSIVFFIHAVSTRHSNFRPLPLSFNVEEILPNQTWETSFFEMNE